MATFAEMRQLLVQMTGHPELVVDAAGGDWDNATDARTLGANYFIQAGLAEIMRLFPHRGEKEEREYRLGQGEFRIETPDLRYLWFVEAVESDGTSRELVKKSLRWLREEYPEDWEDTEEGEPLYWSRAFKKRESVLTDDAYDPVTYADEGWSTLVGCAATATTLDITGASGGGGPVSIEMIYKLYDEASDFLDMYPGNYENLRLAFVLDSLTENAQLLIKTANSEGDIETVATITATGTELLKPIQTWASLLYFELYDDGTVVGPTMECSLSAMTLLGLQDPGLYIMPPTDEDRLVRVYGGFYAYILEEDDDECWWSDQKRLDPLMTMVRSIVEKQLHRNETGAKQMHDSAFLSAREIYNDKIHEEVGSLMPSEVRGHIPSM